jgi:rRNA maturation RNase YbeY
MQDTNFYNDSSLKYLPGAKAEKIVRNVFVDENISEYSVNIIVLNDDKIHSMNKQFLNHDYPTDVITFKLEDDPLEGEIYIGAQTAKKQAAEYNVSFSNEILRLAAHGALHLCNYDDATDAQRQEMKKLENKYLEKNV